MVSNGERFVSQLEQRHLVMWNLVIILLQKKLNDLSRLETDRQAKYQSRFRTLTRSDQSFLDEYLSMIEIIEHLTSLAITLREGLLPILDYFILLATLAELLELERTLQSGMSVQTAHESLLEKLIASICPDFITDIREDRNNYANFEQLVDKFIDRLKYLNISSQDRVLTRRALLQLRLLEPR